MKTRTRTTRWRWALLAAAVIAAGVLPFVFLEIGLRIAGYGYPSEFFVPVAGRQAFASNPRFGWRFFPASMARVPVVSYVPAKKQTGEYRIFILGDSAAMGIPEPAFSFGRMLRVLLESRYPGGKFEIVNTAMTAINSHVLLPIARDSARLQPDLFIVLAGNNEVIGPYGPGTVLAGYTPSLSLIRASIWLKSMRTGQLIERALARFHARAEQPQWGGMAMFAGHQIGLGDPKLKGVYRNFRENLAGVAAIARSVNAQLIVSTVPVNLKDNAPFASRHRPGLSPQAEKQWQQLYDRGVEEARAGDCAGARRELLHAEQIDYEFAGLHYELGRCLLALGDEEEARTHLVAARDLDTRRFRADTEINREIRDFAAAADSRARLVDAERDLATVPGDDLFYEHVHLRFAGNYLLSKAMMNQIETVLPEAVRQRRCEVSLSESGVASALGFTEWDRDKSEMEMLSMRQQAPFTPRPENQDKLSQLQLKWSAPDRLAGLQQHVAQYQDALMRNPADPELREMLAELLTRSGDYPAAARQYRLLIELIPDVPRWHANLAGALLRQQELSGAQAEAETALRLDPKLAAAQFTLGSIAESSNDPAQAISRYEDLLRTRPDYADAWLRLGILLGKQGRNREAIDKYREYLHLAPGSPQVESNLGVLLVRVGDAAAAVPHYQTALRLNPNFPEAAINLGAALERLGRRNESIAYYRQALQLRPGFAEARRRLDAALAASPSAPKVQ